MRVLISADTYYPHVNGASYFAQRLAEYLQKRGNQVAVICPGESFKHTKKVINGILVYGARSVPVLVYRDFRFSFYVEDSFVQKIIDEFKPDVIHIQAHFVVGRRVAKVAFRNNLPLVATNHFMPENLTHYIPLPNFVVRMISEFMWRDFAKVFNTASRISTPTKIAAGLIENRVNKDVESISCGIDLDRFTPNDSGVMIREKYNLPDRPVLLFVGRLDKEKNVDLVLKSVAIALKFVDFQFVVVGKGAEKKNLERLAQRLSITDNVTFTGFVSDGDLPAMYRASDCFIIAGTAELQSIVTMEAMASGLPVLAVNAVALPELVLDNENGFLFGHGDIDDLAGKMVKIFTDEKLREKMAQLGLEIIAKHDINESMVTFERMYNEEILKKKNVE
ncbi:MAG: glycosyltransferase [Candidatus Vogelbacteria bacterium]|nr:glycosyltransferase [Candidatus Vogelbacteria bacterium]